MSIDSVRQAHVLADETGPSGLQRGTTRKVFGPLSSPNSRADLDDIWARVLPNRGRSGEIRRLFETTPVPMNFVDNDRTRVDVNPAARLFLRSTLAEIQAGDPYDLLPAEWHGEADRQWAVLQREGSVAGSIPIKAPDGQTLEVDFCGVANVLPGAHLFVWMPADWPDDELAAVVDGGAPKPRGRLTEREREVLSLLATGATLEEIATRLTLAQSTVKTHLRNAHTRLGARHRAHALAIAIRDGEIDVE